jgi:hypothetical protein
MPSLRDSLFISRSLDNLKYQILDAWVLEVKETIVSAQDLSSPIIIDHLDDILDDLKLALHAPTLRNREMGRAHGFQRALLTSFTVKELLVEYQILRAILISQVTPFIDEQNARKIHLYLDQLCTSAMFEFLDYRLSSHLQKRPRW